MPGNQKNIFSLALKTKTRLRFSIGEKGIGAFQKSGRIR